VIGSGLPQIRQSWDVGLGAPRHQPANLMVGDGPSPF
jgi:hypothetical protein